MEAKNTQKKKVATKSNRTNKVSKTTSKTSKKKQNNMSALTNEIIGLLTLTLGILTFIALYLPNTIGVFGNGLVGLLSGLFGQTAYAAPFFFMAFGVFRIFNKVSHVFIRRFTYAAILIIIIAAFIQTSHYEADDFSTGKIFDVLKKLYYDGYEWVGGGLFGGIVALPLLKLFNVLGTIIVLLVISLIDIILLTNMSISNFLRNFGAIMKPIPEKLYEVNEQKRLSQMELNETKDTTIDNSSDKKSKKIIDFNLEKLKWKNRKDKEEKEVIQEKNEADLHINDENFMAEEDLSFIDAQEPKWHGTLKDFTEDNSINDLNISFSDESSMMKNRSQHTQRKSNESERIESLPEIVQENTTSDDSNIRKSKPKREEAEKLEIQQPIATEEVYNYPPLSLLNNNISEANGKSERNSAAEGAKKLEETLKSFGVDAKVINVSRGPAVTRYELSPSPGVKVSKIVNLSDDISLNLAAAGVRIEAPIPGKAAIGIEVPNKNVTPVYLREVLENQEFSKFPSKLAFAVGKDVSGETVVADIAKMPHMLVAGATGSGKSVCINSLLVSILYKASPQEVKLLMIDPKVVELGVYNGIPHLLIPVVTEPKKAAGALNWAVQEMVNRYKLFAECGVRDLSGYNATRKELNEPTLPQIVIIIDELADLMMVAPNDVEDAVCRLAQMARAAGMHLVIATQRPSVDVITGVIKANIPSRIAFAVSSQVDSRTIIDMGGAEKLLGKGDMLFYPVGQPKPIRVKGAFVTDKEVEKVVEFVKASAISEYDENIIEEINNENVGKDKEKEAGDCDELLNQAIEMIIDIGQASTSLVQRKFKVGYARAARIVDQMEARGIVGRFEGSKPRQVLISKQQWMELQMAGNNNASKEQQA